MLSVVLSVAGLVVSRLHSQFASEDLNADANADIEIVQLNPKVVVYEIFGPAGSTASISYFDDQANLRTPSERSPRPTADARVRSHGGAGCPLTAATESAPANPMRATPARSRTDVAI